MRGVRVAAACLVVAVLIGAIAVEPAVVGPQPAGRSGTVLVLPSPLTRGPLSLEEVLLGRRSVRDLSDRELTEVEIGQLLWAAQGVTDTEGRRTAPSAGALYPLELYAVMAAGLFHYEPARHALALVRGGDLRGRLRAAALDQTAVGAAPLVVVVTAVPARTEARYGPERAMRYAHLEAGHAAQNLLLEATALGLGAVPVGAFDDAAVGSLLGLTAGEVPVYLVPVGHPA